jgi:hypothetical protein
MPRFIVLPSTNISLTKFSSGKLSPEGINAVLEVLYKNGNAEPIDKTKIR